MSKHYLFQAWIKLQRKKSIHSQAKCQNLAKNDVFCEKKIWVLNLAVANAGLIQAQAQQVQCTPEYHSGVQKLNPSFHNAT